MPSDFMGQPITVGAWVASGAGGNKDTEYGMILHRVISLDPLKLQRLTVTYPSGSSNAVASTRTSTVKNALKYVVVVPPKDVVTLFEAAVEGKLTAKQHARIGKWIHGQLPVF